jgi:hypothetical protein
MHAVAKRRFFTKYGSHRNQVRQRITTNQKGLLISSVVSKVRVIVDANSACRIEAIFRLLSMDSCNLVLPVFQNHNSVFDGTVGPSNTF